MQGVRIEVKGVGFRVKGSGFRATLSKGGFRTTLSTCYEVLVFFGTGESLRYGNSRFELRSYDLGFKDSGFRVGGLGFRV